MRSRCSRPSDVSYARYGGRGIRVCERWLTYENFLADVGRSGDLVRVDHRAQALPRQEAGGEFRPRLGRGRVEAE